MNIQPLGEYIAAQRLATPEKTPSGIVLPQFARDRNFRAKIVAIGNGKLLDNGERIRPTVKVGDSVLYSQFAGIEVELEGQKYLFLKETEILAIEK